MKNCAFCGKAADYSWNTDDGLIDLCGPAAEMVDEVLFGLPYKEEPTMDRVRTLEELTAWIMEAVDEAAAEEGDGVDG